jgi:hypothetical protein
MHVAPEKHSKAVCTWLFTNKKLDCLKGPDHFTYIFMHLSTVFGIPLGLLDSGSLRRCISIKKMEINNSATQCKNPEDLNL